MDAQEGRVQGAESGAISGVVELPTPTKRVRLNTADNVRGEMARVYREMRSGKLDVNLGTKFTYVLAQIGKMIEVSVIEKRIEQLEQEVRGE